MQCSCFQESVDALIKCVSQNIGFCQRKPVAAFTIYRCLLHWKSFEAERTSVFDRLIQMIGSAIEVIGCHHTECLFVTNDVEESGTGVVRLVFCRGENKAMVCEESTLLKCSENSFKEQYCHFYSGFAK